MIQHTYSLVILVRMLQAFALTGSELSFFIHSTFVKIDKFLNKFIECYGWWYGVSGSRILTLSLSFSLSLPKQSFSSAPFPPLHFCYGDHVAQVEQIDECFLIIQYTLCYVISDDCVMQYFLLLLCAGEVYSVACSPTDATLVATGGGDDKGFFWRINRGDWVSEIQGKFKL